LARFKSTVSNRTVDQIAPSTPWSANNIVFRVSGRR
jgi:hypothetical protein